MVCFDIPSPHVNEMLCEDRHHIPWFFILCLAVHVEGTPSAETTFIHLFIHSFIYQAFIQYLYVVDIVLDTGYCTKQSKVSALMELTI